jgi:deazaflavin-dependent oxidoreductase (nitroreductase family)
MEADLVASGRFARIETHGRRPGQIHDVTVGFIEDPDLPGAVVVASGDPDSVWARNLLDDPEAQVTIGERGFRAIAELLEPAEHNRAIAELILRYGTSSEGLGRGPTFRLVPVGEGER